ncbi:unnamed protein product, partial [Urochloa humidicola]
SGEPSSFCLESPPRPCAPTAACSAPGGELQGSRDPGDGGLGVAPSGGCNEAAAPVGEVTRQPTGESGAAPHGGAGGLRREGASGGVTGELGGLMGGARHGATVAGLFASAGFPSNQPVSN